MFYKHQNQNQNYLVLNLSYYNSVSFTSISFAVEYNEFYLTGLMRQDALVVPISITYEKIMDGGFSRELMVCYYLILQHHYHSLSLCVFSILDNMLCPPCQSLSDLVASLEAASPSPEAIGCLAIS